MSPHVTVELGDVIEAAGAIQCDGIYVSAYREVAAAVADAVVDGRPVSNDEIVDFGNACWFARQDTNLTPAQRQSAKLVYASIKAELGEEIR